MSRESSLSRPTRRLVMRKVILTVVLAGLLCMPLLAQFGFGGRMGGGVEATTMLASKDVQKDLKLDDDQVKAVTKATEDRNQGFKDAFKDGELNREAMQKTTEAYTKALGKVREGLKSDQKKRLDQLEVQAA